MEMTKTNKHKQTNKNPTQSRQRKRRDRAGKERKLLENNCSTLTKQHKKKKKKISTPNQHPLQTRTSRELNFHPLQSVMKCSQLFTYESGVRNGQIKNQDF